MIPESQTTIRKMSTSQRESVEVTYYGYEAFLYLDAPREVALTPEEAWALSDMLREAARGKGYTGPKAKEALDLLRERLPAKTPDPRTMPNPCDEATLPGGLSPLRHPGSYGVAPDHVPTWTPTDLRPYCGVDPVSEPRVDAAGIEPPYPSRHVDQGAQWKVPPTANGEDI